MAEETENAATLLARREYARAVPLLARDLAKYPTNPRIRLQYADALAGTGSHEEAVKQYEETAKYYEDNGLTVQAIAVRKKAEKVRAKIPAAEMELEQHGEGDVIISEGQPGSAMYVIASGEVKVFTSGKDNKAVYLAKLGEGDFFGEVSVLTGKPRTATITASQPTSLLRLDKEKLDNALARYPGIRKVLDEFYRKRARHTVEAMIESMKKRQG